MREVKLGWAIGPGGEIVDAASMVGVEPSTRPRVTCPCCEETVTIRAGERGIVTPHVAHPPDSTCAVTNPETAEHMNAKLQLARALSLRSSLRVRVRCNFGHAVEADWCVPAWKRAEPEFRVGTRRPDVALLDEGVVAAVEVLRSHSVDRAKSRDLAESGVPWVEIRADHVLSWDGDSALPVEAGDQKSLRELVQTCSMCHAMDYPTGDPMPPEELARQAKKIRAALGELKRTTAVTSAPTTDEFAQWAEQDRVQREDFDRRQKSGKIPVLHVVAAYAIDGQRVAVGAICALPGAKANVRVIDHLSLVTSHQASWLAVEYAVGLVEGRAKRPASVWIADIFLRAANFAARPGTPDSEHERTQRRVIDAVARTRSMVLFTPMRPELMPWQKAVEAACIAAVNAST